MIYMSNELIDIPTFTVISDILIIFDTDLLILLLLMF